MKPVLQTDFVEYDAEGKQIKYGNCLQAAIASVLELPLEEVPNFIMMGPDPSYGHYNMHKWLEERGIVMHRLREGRNWSFPTYHLAIGKTVRGTNHAVIYKEGRLAHDPHPDGTGLIEAKDLYILIPVDPSKIIFTETETDL